MSRPQTSQTKQIKQKDKEKKKAICQLHWKRLESTKPPPVSLKLIIQIHKSIGQSWKIILVWNLACHTGYCYDTHCYKYNYFKQRFVEDKSNQLRRWTHGNEIYIPSLTDKYKILSDH